jgi:flavin-dependent dehydrogenase
MSSFDAIIVGAGPAGSSCAGRLQRAGLNVKLLDKQAFPRVKPCAGWITPDVVHLLHVNVPQYQARYTWQPVTGFCTGVIGGRMIETTYPRAVSYGIRRCEFDDYLLQRSGVECHTEAVRHIQRDAETWCINDRYHAPLLIGAGGHFCPVARWARHQQVPSRSQSPARSGITVYAQEIEIRMPETAQGRSGVRPHMPELYFCRDLGGYGWCFRKGEFLNIGMGRTRKQDLSAHVHDFCDCLRDRDKIGHQHLGKFLGHAYQLYADSLPLLYGDGLLLIGDSAGLAYPQSGEGIRPAVESALLAADLVLELSGDYRRERLAGYARRLEQHLGRPRPIRPARWLPESWLQHIATRLMATRWFTKRVVIENWFLNRSRSAASFGPVPR